MQFNRNTFLCISLVLFITAVSFVPHFMSKQVINFVGYYYKNKQQVKLSWQTTTEIGLKSFVIERRKPSGDEWDMLGFVPSSGEANNYSFTDPKPLSLNYYRLRMIDNYGRSTFSDIISVSIESVNKFRAFPVIVKESLLNLEGVENYEILPDTVQQVVGSTFKIVNMLGQSVLKGKTKPQIDISTLREGTYTIKIGTEQAKFIKQ